MTRALDLLRSAIEPIRVKPGCRGCYMARDADEGGTVRYTEEWTSADAFRRHVQSEEFWPILIAMDLCSLKPQVRISDLAMRGGLELLLQMRDAPRLDLVETTEPPTLEPGEGQR